VIISFDVGKEYSEDMILWSGDLKGGN